MAKQQSVTTRDGDRIAIVAGLRTPFAKMATYFHGVPAVDLGKMVVNELLIRNAVDPKLVDQLVYGQVVQMPEAPNIAREIVLGTGMNVHTDAYSVSRACATSFQSTVNIAESMMAGTVEVGVAGGADSTSVSPIGVSKKLARALVDIKAPWLKGFTASAAGGCRILNRSVDGTNCRANGQDPRYYS